MSAPKRLNKKCYEVLEFLKQSQMVVSPVTIRDIQAATGITSTSVVNYYLDKLELFGKIEPRKSNTARFIKVAKKSRKKRTHEGRSEASAS